MQTRKDGIRGKIIKSCISNSCGFSPWKALFLENQNLLVTFKFTCLPKQEPWPTLWSSSFLLLQCFSSPSRPWNQACMASPSDLLDMTYPWPAAAFTTTLVESCIFCLWLYPTFQGLAFFRGLLQLCFTRTSASDNQSSFQSPAAPKALQQFFLLKYSLGLFNKKGQKLQCVPFMPYTAGGKYPATQSEMIWIIG